MSRFDLFAAGATLLCSCGMSSEQLAADMRKQVSLPECADLRVNLVRTDSYGQDWTDHLDVTASEDCLERWQTKLAKSREYQCKGRPLACTRYDESGRYKEEWATVTFVQPRLATVELTKI